MTADTDAMRAAAYDMNHEEEEYYKSIENLKNLISVKLRNAWEDDASKKFIEDYERTGSVTFENLDKVLKEFSNEIIKAADDIDSTIKKLM